jgi:anhydro-N-acetylmuramic acid kinase
MIVIGMMSGTSADGVDLAVMSLEGTPAALNWQLIKHIYVAYPAGLRDQVLDAVTEHARVPEICALNVSLAEFYADAVQHTLAETGLAARDVRALGNHGQTVWHIPARATLQIGEPAVLAERTGIQVVSNFRARDIAAGGQGAPLVAYVDRLLFAHPTKTRALQNLGGIGNVTWLSPSGERSLAFDTGPANMLIDDVARRATGGALQCDLDGALAARGRLHGPLLEELLSHPFFAEAPPKTTGREVFGAQMGAQLWARAQALGITPADLAATVTWLTAASVADAYRDHLPALPDEVIVSGGGTRNPVLMHMLRDALGAIRPGIMVDTSDAYGMSSEAKEAACFAILAYETLHGRSGNLPSATGARRPVVLGSITPA